MYQIPLYPLRFKPIYQYRLWGGRRLANLPSTPLPGDGPIGEAWILSDRDDHPSLVADGPLKGSTIAQLLKQSPTQLLKKWDAEFIKRKKIKGLLDKLIPEFSVRLGGATSIDVTKPGIDKGYGIRKLRDVLGVAIPEMIFIGDAVFPGGNDYPAKEAGAQSIEVKDPHETKRVIEAIVACLEAS